MILLVHVLLERIDAFEEYCIAALPAIRLCFLGCSESCHQVFSDVFVRCKRALASVLGLESHLGAAPIRRVPIRRLLQLDAEAGGRALVGRSRARLHPPSGQLRYGVEVYVLGLDEGQFALHAARRLQSGWLRLRRQQALCASSARLRYSLVRVLRCLRLHGQTVAVLLR